MMFTAGKLIAGRVRRCLQHIKWERDDFDFYETKGFIDNTFSLKGPDDLLKKIYEDLKNSS